LGSVFAKSGYNIRIFSKFQLLCSTLFVRNLTLKILHLKADGCSILADGRKGAYSRAGNRAFTVAVLRSAGTRYAEILHCAGASFRMTQGGSLNLQFSFCICILHYFACRR
jgi:hypothetical protein